MLDPLSIITLLGMCGIAIVCISYQIIQSRFRSKEKSEQRLQLIEAELRVCSRSISSMNDRISSMYSLLENRETPSELPHLLAPVEKRAQYTFPLPKIAVDVHFVEDEEELY